MTDTNETPLEQAIRILFRPDDIVEVRGKRLSDGKCRSKFVVQKTELINLVQKGDLKGNYEAIWCSLQRLKPDLMQHKQQGEACARADVMSYEWLVVDIDRPAGDPNKKLNATDDELARLHQVARNVASWLRNQGFPDPILACSGNGWHLLYKLPSLGISWYDDLKNVLKSIERAFLQVSGKLSEGKICQIDTTLAEPEQMCKIYGTTSRKTPADHPEIGTRPWRVSRMKTVPDPIRPVSDGALFLLAQKAPTTTKKLKRSKDGLLNPDWHPEDLFEWAEPYIVIKEEYEEDGVQCFVATSCVGDIDDPLHVHQNRTVYRWGDSFGVKCFADQCAELHVGTVLKNLAQLKGEPYPARIWLEDTSMFNIDSDDPDELETPAASEQAPEPPEPGEGPIPVPEPGAAPLSEDAALEFPVDCLYGVLGEQAQQLEVPLGYGYPAIIGVYSLEPDFDEMADGTRINTYTAITGGVGSGKNEAIKRAAKLRGLLSGVEYKRAELASNRGLMNLIGEKSKYKKGGDVEKIPGPQKFLLHTNEIVAIFKKASIDNSTLFEMLCDLWDENDYSVPDRKGTQSCNCRLSWIGGLPVKTAEDFAKVFGKQTSFGLMSRFIFGYTTEQWRFRPWTLPAPTGRSITLQAGVPTLEDARLPAAETLVDRFSEGAVALMEAWWPVQNAADPSNRVFFNLKKVALLTASANHDREVSAECMAKAIKFMEWQIALRVMFRPSEASTEAAAFGERVMRYLEKHTRKMVMAGKVDDEGCVRINWRLVGHNQKWSRNEGAWMFFSTIQSLLRVGELLPVRTDDEETLDSKFNVLPRYVRIRKGVI